MFSFLGYKTLRAVVTLSFSNFFQSFYPDGKFIPSHLHSFTNGLFFVILRAFFPISS